MWYRRNIPGWEGWLRIVAGLGMLGWGVLHFQAAHGGAGLALGGVFMAGTGFVGFCPVCKLVGRKPPDQA